MYNSFTDKEKENIVVLYIEGQSVASLCSEYDIPRSTLYSWINKYQTVKSANQASVSYKEYSNLKRRVEMLEERLKVIKESGCSPSALL